jgi:hypothetical protein
MTMWLTLFASVTWLALAEINYAFFRCIFPIIATAFAGLGVELSQFTQVQITWSNFLGTYALAILLLAAFLVPRLARRHGWNRRLWKPMAVVGSVGLISVATIMVSDGRYLASLWPKIGELMVRWNAESSESRGRECIRRVIIAEYRYRELHPKVGFACERASFDPLGGPVRCEQPSWAPKKPNVLSIDIYTLSIGNCQGQPVITYGVSAVPDPSAYGSKAAAYCSDGSGALYFATDGRSETCLAARKPFN